MLTCAKISVLALSTCLTLAASFRNLAMARGDWVTSPCVLYFSYKDVEDKFQSIHTSKCDHSNESYCKFMMFNFQNLLVNVDFLLLDLRHLFMIKYLEDFDQMIS